MGVHTFFTGIRGLAAPLVGFTLAARYPMTSMGWVAAGLIGVGTLFLIPDARDFHVRRRAAQAVPPAAPIDAGEG
jgi:hypothetical protein